MQPASAQELIKELKQRFRIAAPLVIGGFAGFLLFGKAGAAFGLCGGILFWIGYLWYKVNRKTDPPPS